ncbi:MAG: hypothetical protein K2P93_02680 [Alphaproteobacteria bacterium]|nr:hypothetical protein [Alphaproteobacteria bacterium]
MQISIAKLSSVGFLFSLIAVNAWAMTEEDFCWPTHRNTKLQRSHSEPLLGEKLWNSLIHSFSSSSPSLSPFSEEDDEEIKPLILTQSINSPRDSLRTILDCLTHCTDTIQADRMLQFLMATKDLASRAQMLAELQKHAHLPGVTAPLFRRLIDVISHLLEGVDDSEMRVSRVKDLINGFNEVYGMAYKLNDLFPGEKKITNAKKFTYIIGKLEDQNIYWGYLLFSILKKIERSDLLMVLDDFYAKAMEMNSDGLSAHIEWAYKKLQEPSDSAEDDPESGEGA